MMRRLAVAVLASAAFVAAPFAFAQSLTDLSSSGGVPPISLSLSTQYPQPYSGVMLSVTSTTLTLANATLTVSVNGKSVYQGNVQPVPITIGAPGVVTTIKATVVSQGASYPATITVDPGDVSLVEEPLASAPPLYAGKPLVPISGQVRLVAVASFHTASGAAISPANLSYTWMQDDTTLGSVSGIGKSVAVVAAPLQYRSGNYSVIVTTQDGSEVGSASVSLSPQDPTIRVYTNDPLLGIRFDHALGGTFSITDPEASFYAAPFSFSLTSGAPSINWFLGGSPAATGNVVTLRPTGSGVGQSSLSVTAAETQYYENASASFTLSYGAKSGGGIFGL